MGPFRCCDRAAAQLCQNLKAKIQAVQGGDWTAAWLLTGLVDPFEYTGYAGSKREMAVIAAYDKEMVKLAKLVAEAGGSSSSKPSEET